VSSAVLAGGTDPTVVTSDYSNAFNAFEAYRFNAITIDTCEDAVKSLLQEYIDRVYQSGKWSYCGASEIQRLSGGQIVLPVRPSATTS
jgi:hypothetical protein